MLFQLQPQLMHVGSLWTHDIVHCTIPPSFTIALVSTVFTQSTYLRLHTSNLASHARLLLHARTLFRYIIRNMSSSLKKRHKLWRIVRQARLVHLAILQYAEFPSDWKLRALMVRYNIETHPSQNAKTDVEYLNTRHLLWCYPYHIKAAYHFRYESSACDMGRKLFASYFSAKLNAWITPVSRRLVAYNPASIAANQTSCPQGCCGLVNEERLWSYIQPTSQGWLW